jgi:hypothetical protein
MTKMSTTIAGVHFKNPIIMASGTFGFGREYGKLYDVSLLGGISGKGLTLHPKAGNPGTRVYETASGMLNSGESRCSCVLGKRMPLLGNTRYSPVGESWRRDA